MAVIASFDGPEALGAARAAAEDAGLVLAIAPLPAGADHEATVAAAGFAVASEFYVGTPSSG